MITGIPTITRERKILVIGDYYRSLNSKEYCIGPPIEAVDTATIEFTGRWRLVGDVDNPKLEVEADIDWTITPREWVWLGLGWPLFDVEEGEPEAVGTTVWLAESSIHWNMPNIINHNYAHSGGRIK